MAMPASAAAGVDDEPRYGWVIVALAPLFLGFAIGSLGAIAVFLKPLVAEFNWLRGETSFSYLAGNLTAGLGGILMGALADRYSTRSVLVFGALAAGVAFLAMSQQSTLWEFYLYTSLAAGLGSAAFFAPLLANIGGWFTRNRGLAIGIATAGQALGQGIVPFAAGLLITWIGWRNAYAALGAFALAVLLPLALLVRTPPQRVAGDTSAAALAAEAQRLAVPFPLGLGMLSVAAVFCCITMATPLVHVVALASDRGLGPENAAAVLLLLMVSGFCGRIAFGRFSDRIGGLRAYWLASLWQTSTVFWFTQIYSAVGFHIMAVVFGFGYAGVMTCFIISAQELAPRDRAALATAVASLAGFTGMGIGGFQGGLFFDLTGNYIQSYANAAFAGMYNLVIVGTLYFYRRERIAALAPAGAGD